MKKLIALLLALVMVLSLVACGDKKDDAAGTDDSDATSQDTITLKMHFVDPETAPFVQGGKKIAELVSEATDGRIQIEVLAGGSLGGERDTIELAMDNSLDRPTWRAAPWRSRRERTSRSPRAPCRTRTVQG